MLEITDLPVPGYERVRRAVDSSRGLHAIVAVHNTVLGRQAQGPNRALGGMRLWPYASLEAAKTDVLRLARGMTYKAACADLPLGGGKSVILGKPEDKTPAMFEAMGEFVESFGGSYITAEDVNTKVEDMAHVARKTRHVAGLAGKSGNPSPKTAWGCFLGLQATLEEAFGTPEVAGRTVAIEGAGSVGTVYGELIAKHGGKLIVADIRAESAKRLAAATGGRVVSPTEIHKVACDVYAPCALGGSLNDETIPQLNCRAVVGAANNQLLEDRHGDALKRRGILYAPDYVVNAGGLINVFCELDAAGYDEARSLRMAEKIRTNLREIFAISREEGLSTAAAANRFAERRIEAARAEARR
jgi:leucine dehydrogenase